METIQDKIELEARNRVFRLLQDAGRKEHEISDILGHNNYKRQLDYSIQNVVREGIQPYQEPSESIAKEIFNKLLPRYLQIVTNEFWNKVQSVSDLEEEIKKLKEERLPDLPFD